ncbi:MAG: porphobilinogen synthase [Phycisphaeraceae bacterium]|nr:porphobilinogen synthase [Phycisphaeraceae bacterium]
MAAKKSSKAAGQAKAGGQGGDRGFPAARPRRLRRGQTLRDVVADVSVRPENLIYPMFVGAMDKPTAVASMPGVKQWPVGDAVTMIRQWREKGLKQFIFFGVTPAKKKDATGSYAASADAPVNRTLAAVRDAGLDVVMYADLCLCEYTDHGHCGALCPGDKQGVVDNDRTLELLAKVAAAQAKAGAEVVAPSGMMDGQVRAIRAGLDGAGFKRTAIMAYSVKFASGFYGPFREAGQGGMTFGDRRGYQMDYRRAREWRTELALDLAEGADMVMVKPAATYLDVIYQVRQATAVPVAAYHVSGEFAMLHAAAERGWVDLKAAALETTYAIKRAGADLILTYFAPQLVEWL